MALDDLLAPMVIFFAFSVPNLDKDSPSASIPRLKRPPGMRWASVVFSSINEGEEAQWYVGNILNGSGGKDKPPRG